MAPSRWIPWFFLFTLQCSTAFLARLLPSSDILQHDDTTTPKLDAAFRHNTRLRSLQIGESTEDEDGSSTDFEIVLFGVGDLRIDDHEGIQKALSYSMPRKVLPLVILDDASISKIPGVVSHTVDTANLIVAAVADLQKSLKEKLDLDLQVVSSSGTLVEALFEVVQLHGSTTQTVIHVHDLGEADNSMGYGPYAQLMDTSILPTNVKVAPWACQLRSTPWQEVASLPERYPDFVQKFASEVPNQPVSLNDDGIKGIQKIEVSSESMTVPSAEELVGRLQATLGLDPAVVISEVNTGIFQSHWGGLDATTVGESKVLQNLNKFIDDCQEDDELWVQHPQYVAKRCQRNERSLEHATFNWMMRGTSSGGTETNNLLAGESMTRYLSAPLLLGTLSARRLWHMSTRQRPYFDSPLKTLAEGREWHKLLAASNIQSRPEYQGLNESDDLSEAQTRYGYWRWHGFLCRYAQTPLSTPADADSNTNKEGVLLFHGFGASGSQWNKAMSELASIVAEEPSYGSVMEGLAPDLIGFGHSEKPAITYSIYVWDGQCTDFVKEVAVCRQGWDSYIVGGNSIGGFSAASTAANECAEVEGSSVCSSGAPGTSKCRGVVLMNPAGPIQSREDIEQMQANVGGDGSKLQTVAQITATDSLPACKPLPRPVARLFGNGLLSYLRPRIQSICVNLYPTNPAAVDDNLCNTIERDSVDPGGINVMVSGTKLPPPRSMNQMLKADYGCASQDSAVSEASFDGPVLVAQGVLDPLNDAKSRAKGLAALRDGIEFDSINAGHCPHDELPNDVAISIAKWMKSTVKPMNLARSTKSSSIPFFAAER